MIVREYDLGYQVQEKCVEIFIIFVWILYILLFVFFCLEVIFVYVYCIKFNSYDVSSSLTFLIFCLLNLLLR